MKRTTYLIYLDGYHLGDPVFLDDLARSAASRSGDLPSMLLFHGSGEKAERTLEGAGHFVERENGVIAVKTEEQRRLVERATREANKEIVEKLTDQQLSAVGIQGIDRNFFSITDGEVITGNINWLDNLLTMQVVPVVSGLARSNGQVQEVTPSAAIMALVRHLQSDTTHVTVIAFAKRIPEEHGTADKDSAVQLDHVDNNIYAEPGLLRRLVEEGAEVSLTEPSSFFGKPPEVRISENDNRL